MAMLAKPRVSAPDRLPYAAASRAVSDSPPGIHSRAANDLRGFELPQVDESPLMESNRRPSPYHGHLIGK